jgi:hypothetical protein
MGYSHIENLYQNQEILMFKECYALEKIHGSSTHITWKYETKELIYFAGGESHTRFVEYFNNDLKELFEKEFPFSDCIVYGEAYGGKCQGMSNVYGKELRFVGFDVKIDSFWLNVPNAHNVCDKLNLDFVDYVKIPTTIEAIDAERDKPSVQSVKCGIKGPKAREGIVLRPLIELRKNNDSRIVSKHKGNNYKETKTQREISPGKLKVYEKANEIAEEFVVPMRLTHVLNKFPKDINMKDTKEVIKAMVEDIYREAKDEIVENRETVAAIGKQTAKLLKDYLNKQIGQ